MIADAVAAWNAGGDAAGKWASVLDGWNNSKFENGCPVKIICAAPCYPIVY
jgi:hypothetical protein